MFREWSFRSEAGITPFMDGYCVGAEDSLLPAADVRFSKVSKHLRSLDTF
jgi:hypothetical protein